MLHRKNVLKEQKAYAKRLSSWVNLSSVARSAITDATWYTPREDLTPSTLRQKATEHRIFSNDNPFEVALLNDIEHYLTKHNTRAFLIWHKGKLVHSHYINFQPNFVFNSMSLVKSLLGLCIGVALDERFLLDINEPAHHYLPEWKNDARKYITIDHLLTMQSGLHSDVAVNKRKAVLPVIPLYLGTNIRKIALSLPAVAPPEQRFVYNNYNSQLLGIILERASGMTFAQFASKYLWQPLGCGKGFAWVDDHGMARTYGGFFARPIDWVKLAELILYKGNYQGTQLVSESWIDTMQTPTNTSYRGLKNAHADYGRHLWLESHHYGKIAGIPSLEGMYARHKHADESMVYFEGMRGQYVFISPAHELIVMRMGEKPKKSWDGSRVINQLIHAL